MSKIDQGKDAEFSRLIRARDGWRCQACGKQISEEYPAMLHSAHCFSRRHKATRFDPDNVVSLCSECHYYFDRHKSTLYELFKNRLGDERFEELRMRHLEIIKGHRWNRKLSTGKTE